MSNASQKYTYHVAYTFPGGSGALQLILEFELNTPAAVERIGQIIAELRGVPASHVIVQSWQPLTGTPSA